MKADFHPAKIRRKAMVRCMEPLCAMESAGWRTPPPCFSRFQDSYPPCGLVKSGSARSRRGSAHHWSYYRVVLSALIHGRRSALPSPKLPHTAPQVRNCPASAGPPTISTSALLDLARWCQARRQQEGGTSCDDNDSTLRPPALATESAQAQATSSVGPTLDSSTRTTRSRRRSAPRPASRAQQRKRGQS